MFHNGHGGQKRTGTGRFSEKKNKEILTVISPDQPTDNLEMIHGGQDKTETNMVSDTEISPEQPTDNLEMIHGGHNKTETNMVSDTENILTVVTHEQTSTDQLMDKAYQTSTDQLMDKAYQTSIDQLMDKAYQTSIDQLMDKAYQTSIDQLMDKSYQTSTDQLMDRAYQTCTDQLMDKAYHTREKVDAGNECGKEYKESVYGRECHGIICGKECHGNECGKECHGNVCGKECHGNFCGKECHGNSCVPYEYLYYLPLNFVLRCTSRNCLFTFTSLTKDKLDELCFKEWIRICKALVKVLIIMIMMIMDCYSNLARNIAGTTIRFL
ncbi:KRAB [Mytilus coruscus]|uniref:KRAB n=1 Tax=Mytilus coruscus TaxID=42192 RepID=A0A6J8ACH6_MYTCO|nr:KRAB [Mytilus coruscus]